MSRSERDYSETLFLPQTDFPMRAGLPQREPDILRRWEQQDLYGKLRQAAKGRDKFILHDGPPYANGNIHIGHALNKVLKDVVTRSQQMLGHDSNYVPGWDCHGLPIEWKIEEENYRTKSRKKPDLSDPVAMIAFRRECRAYAERWLNVQREEFKRLGVVGDWKNPYTTMSFAAEAQIARELLKFLIVGTTHGFPVMGIGATPEEAERLRAAWRNASVVIWTTTPWTLPGNRAICFSPRIAYGLFEVVETSEGSGAKAGDHFLLAEKLAPDVMKSAKISAFKKIAEILPDQLTGILCAHRFRGRGYDFAVPLLCGDHVTDDVGTGFVHTAPGHGREDFDVWTANKAQLEAQGINTAIPYTVDENGAFTDAAPGFTGKRVLTDTGERGDANEAVITAL